MSAAEQLPKTYGRVHKTVAQGQKRAPFWSVHLTALTYIRSKTFEDTWRSNCEQHSQMLKKISGTVQNDAQFPKNLRDKYVGSNQRPALTDKEPNWLLSAIVFLCIITVSWYFIWLQCRTAEGIFSFTWTSSREAINLPHCCNYFFSPRERALSSWTHERGIAPVLRQGLVGLWTPTFQLFQFSEIATMHVTAALRQIERFKNVYSFSPLWGMEN